MFTLSGENVSPYAEPLHVVMSSGNIGRSNTGKIRLKIRLGADSQGRIDLDVSGRKGNSFRVIKNAAKYVICLLKPCIYICVPNTLSTRGL